MIDSLEMLRSQIEGLQEWREFGMQPGKYAMVTMHRPSNVDSPAKLMEICSLLKELAEETPLVFPIHPRTRQKMEDNRLFGELQKSPYIVMPEPLNYLRFMNLVFNCRFVVTDSGGVQEETSYLGIPCLTVRQNTERPITIAEGTNELCELQQVKIKVQNILVGPLRRQTRIELWDGKTAGRIVEILNRVCERIARSARQRMLP